MTNTASFISILKDSPWIGMIIGFLFFSFMFGVKNIIIYFYSRKQESYSAKMENSNGKM